MWNRDSLLHLMAAGKAHNLRGAQSSQEVFPLALFLLYLPFFFAPLQRKDPAHLKGMHKPHNKEGRINESKIMMTLLSPEAEETPSNSQSGTLPPARVRTKEGKVEK